MVMGVLLSVKLSRVIIVQTEHVLLVFFFALSVCQTQIVNSVTILLLGIQLTVSPTVQ